MSHQWAYIKSSISGETQVDVSESELAKLAKTGKLTKKTKLCSATRTKGKWVLAGNVPAIAKAIDRAAAKRKEAKEKKKSDTALAKVEAKKAKQIRNQELLPPAPPMAPIPPVPMQQVPMQQVPMQQPATVVNVNVGAQSQSNSWGMAGFVMSLISFFTCGLLAPIALLLSMVGLLFKPRGFAAAGAALSSISVAILVLGGGVFFLALLGVGTAANEAIIEMEKQAQQQAAVEQPGDFDSTDVESAE